MTSSYEFCLLPRVACFGLVPESKNNATFRVFAVEKGRKAKRMPGRESTGIQSLKLWQRDSQQSLYFLRKNVDGSPLCYRSL